MRTYEGYEWTEEEEENFEVDALVGRLVADGTTRYANQGVASAGTVLYRVVWSGFPADLLWYEPAKNLGTDLVAAFRAAEEAEAAQAAAEAKEEADLLELEAADAAARSQGMGGCSVW